MAERTLRAVLHSPRTPEERQLADDHIRREAARIRDTWTEEVHRERAGLSRRPQSWRCPTVETDFPER